MSCGNNNKIIIKLFQIHPLPTKVKVDITNKLFIILNIFRIYFSTTKEII